MKDDPIELKRTSLIANQSKLMQFNASINDLNGSHSELGSSHAEHACSKASLDVSHQELLEFHAIVGGNRRASLVGFMPALEDAEDEEDEGQKI